MRVPGSPDHCLSCGARSAMTGTGADLEQPMLLFGSHCVQCLAQLGFIAPLSAPDFDYLDEDDDDE